MSLISLSMTGCATRTAIVIDSSSDWVRLVKPVTACVATYKDGKWVEAGNAKIPAGMYIGPGKKP